MGALDTRIDQTTAGASGFFLRERAPQPLAVWHFRFHPPRDRRFRVRDARGEFERKARGFRLLFRAIADPVMQLCGPAIIQPRGDIDIKIAPFEGWRLEHRAERLQL